MAAPIDTAGPWSLKTVPDGPENAGTGIRVSSGVRSFFLDEGENIDGRRKGVSLTGT